MIPHTDIAIIGGGPVGAALALALEGSGLGSVVFEARRAGDQVGRDRPLALSWGSRLLLERLGVWDSLPEASAIRGIEVSQRGGFGRAAMKSEDAGLPALGYVVDYTSLSRTMDARLLECPAAGVHHGARVKAITQEADGICVTADSSDRQVCVRAPLAVVADGLPGGRVPRTERDYRQAALSAQVRTERPHRGIAFERFTYHGPLAVLPHRDGCAIVWTLAPDEALRMIQVDDAEFLEALQGCFGHALGRFLSVRDREVHRVGLRVSAPREEARTIAIGNASQTLHPVAGQGFNLGLRDAWELARALKAAGRAGLESPSFAREFERRRAPDRQSTIRATDGLVRLFSNDAESVRAARGLGLAAFDCLQPIKNAFLHRMALGRR